jgi:ligand-binding sensor protein
MELTDIAPVEKWIDIETEINSRSGLNAAVYNVNGQRITNFVKWANPLCPALRDTEKGQKFICAVAHQNIAARASKDRKTIVAECDAGLMKFVVPIFVDDEFLGTAGGCGLLRDSDKVDSYLISRTAEMDEANVQKLAKDVEMIPSLRLEFVIDYLEKKVNEIVRNYQTNNRSRLEKTN